MVLANRTKLANSRSLVRVFGGLNETYACSEAEYSAGVNFSARDFPALSTRKPRRKLHALTGLNGMYHLNGLLTICGKDIIYTPDDAAAQFAAFNAAASNALSGIYAVLDSTVPDDSTTSLQTELLGSSTLDSTFTTEGSADAIRALHCGDAVAVQYSSLSLIMAVRLDPLDGSSLDAVRSQVLSDLKSDELADALADYGASMEHHLEAPAMNKLPVSKVEPASSSNR